MKKKQLREARRAEKEAKGETVHSAPDVRPVVKRDVLADTISTLFGPPELDMDIPPETRRELMQCATSNGRIPYWYLCDIWRRGRRSGEAA